ncbi:DEAD/H associated family [Cyanobium sp. PCC 7001]|uniref:ligase-associated DNA damage response DEXH box helicase n=1 Tax=Cyanobium sp. PCC 7001 TaxID=180281 RepID=UPI0001805A6D|nr:ligase-associated DNA damage response DEXH box helicase [Cyanobium sp. PCC 7001]EDY39893.1 DEAD/H associated family [Cyanobium sp. PCC 7001]
MRPSIQAQLAPVEEWFRRQGWRPMPFQRQCWKAYLQGQSGLIQVPTGSGKTYAAVMGPIARMLADPRPGLRLLYLTPLRALSRDLAAAIQAPINAMGWPLRLGVRNGDTPGSERTRQLRRPPEILITTPESLCLLLANPRAEELFGGLEAVVLDEWHELMGGKRGSQCELALSWLRRQCPGLRTWAISATIGNLETAARAAVGDGPDPVLITARLRRDTAIRSLVPERIDGFPWAGHLGLRMYEELVAALEPSVSTLLFTNTRNQAERWHQCLRYACPEMEGALALHHSAIDRAEREAIEAGVKAGGLRWVVCTSSLDLGVDFQPVERVVQIGSAKNLARLLQRAGRSAHLPGGTSQVLFMPTNALELLEVSAMRRGLAEGLVEERRPPQAPIDVLLQHLTSLACGPGFHPEEELATVRSAWSYRHLPEASWRWCLRFLEQGGDCLGAYPRYRKLRRVEQGQAERLVVSEPAIARLHRVNIGTITADRAVTVRVVRGAVLGHVEETFISRLKPGDVFFFAGRQLEFVRLREMTAQVKATTRKSQAVPAWAGGQMALSDLLSHHLRQEVDRAARALAAEDTTALDTPELQALEPLLRRQAELSALPRSTEFLVELCSSREGSHLYAYPFEGRFVHEGIGFLWAWRLARHAPTTITVSVNDYGFELLAPRGYRFEALFEEHADALLDTSELEAHLEQAINVSELSRRRFRAIAQISGLVVNGYPGQARTGGQLQISAALLFDVFQRHEPGNLLLAQARAEVLGEQLELPRIAEALQRLMGCRLLLQRTPRPGPLAFPLLAERLNNRMSNESLLARLQRLREQAERQEGC